MTAADRQTEVLANWARAQEGLAATRLLLANRHFDFAASRAYYASFYAATALLLSQGREVTKHSGVLQVHDSAPATWTPWIRTVGMTAPGSRRASLDTASRRPSRSRMFPPSMALSTACWTSPLRT